MLCYARSVAFEPDRTQGLQENNSECGQYPIYQQWHKLAQQDVETIARIKSNVRKQ